MNKKPALLRERGVFLTYISKLRTQAIRDLAGEPYSRFARMHRHYAEAHVLFAGPQFRPIWDSLLKGPLMADPYLAPVRDSIIDWSRRWHIDVDWCHRHAYYALLSWVHKPELREKLDWEIRWTETDIETHYRQWVFEFRYDVPDYAYRRTRLVRNEIHSAFEKSVQDYFKELRASTSETIGLSTPKKHALYHYEWLVRFQVEEWTYEEIFNEYSRDLNLGTIKAVRKAVKEVSDLIQLPLRS